MSEYKEIFKLKEMLEEAKIPFTFYESFKEIEILRGYQIYYPNDRYVCSVIENGGSYGHEQDLLEIMGLLSEEEKESNIVVGYLTAEDVFERISAHYKKENK